VISTMRALAVPGLLSFNGGFVDTAGFLGLHGSFTAHVTGNLVALGAALVFGTHGVIGKLLALPEFIVIVASARIVGAFGSFADSDSPAALLTGFAGITAWQSRMSCNACILRIFRRRRS
jgi:uncharacterized membrane protein YoaK (UPF0700 family)